MYTPSVEGEAIRARLGVAIDPALSRATVPHASLLAVQIGPFRLCLDIRNEAVRRDFQERFWSTSEISGPGDQSVEADLTVLDYVTEETDLLILSPNRRLLAKRLGKVYFGVADTVTLQVLAGSLGTASTPDTLATETDLLQCLIESELLTALARKEPELDFVHASTVARNGRGVLIVGPSGSGKSTLSVAASLQGFQLLGDDIACINLRTRQAYSYPRKPRLRPGGAKLLESLEGEGPEAIAMVKETTLNAICFLGDHAVTPVLRPMAGVDAVWRMTRHIFPAGRPVAPLLARVAQHFPLLPCYELLPGDVQQTVALLHTLTSSEGPVL